MLKVYFWVYSRSKNAVLYRYDTIPYQRKYTGRVRAYGGMTAQSFVHGVSGIRFPQPSCGLAELEYCFSRRRNMQPISIHSLTQTLLVRCPSIWTQLSLYSRTMFSCFETSEMCLRLSASRTAATVGSIPVSRTDDDASRVKAESSHLILSSAG